MIWNKIFPKRLKIYIFFFLLFKKKRIHLLLLYVGLYQEGTLFALKNAEPKRRENTKFP